MDPFSLSFMNPGIIAFALLGGIGPALLWLWFWLREDRVHPEPRKWLILTFLAGMGAVPLVFPFQDAMFELFSASLVALFLTWAALEEFFKLGAAYATGLSSRAMDEPLDMVIYLITAALGFSALENVLFLIDPLLNGTLIDSVITGNYRFIGASLLHVIASASIGVALAFGYFNTKLKKIALGLGGILISIALHTAFNLFIMRSAEEYVVIAFVAVWTGIIVLLVLFERIKRITKRPILGTNQ